MRIAVTGANGFIGTNLRVRLHELAHDDVVFLTRESTRDQVVEALTSADFVFHLAGVNRPKEESEFASGNAALSADLCNILKGSDRRARVAYASSTQVMQDNAYGRSKRAAEQSLIEYERETGAPVYLFQLPNVFGKWAKPDYNSAVATFCSNLAQGLPITVHEPSAPLRLVHIDDVINAFLRLLKSPAPTPGYVEVDPVYETTVGHVAETLRGFVESRSTLITPRTETGLVRALYATYLSYLPAASFAYQVPSHKDARGSFAEILKTPDCGQISVFTARPGVTRGGHYHHSKVEKFVVLSSVAKFRFRNIRTGEMHEIDVRAGDGYVVETVPGWAHDITNTGDEELIVLLWANEIFDPARPDTITEKVDT